MNILNKYIPNIELVKFTEEKEKEYASFMPYVFDELDYYEQEVGHDVDLRYMLIRVNGQERLIQFLDNICVMYYYNEEKALVIRYLELDQAFNIKKVNYGDYTIENDGDTMYFTDEKTGIIHNFDYIKRDHADSEGFDADAVYSQFNPDQDCHLHLVYPLLDRRDGRMYSFHLNDPVRVIFEDKLSSKKSSKLNFRELEAYVKYEFDTYDSLPYFKLVTMREFGIRKMLKEDVVSLQQSDKIKRYFRIHSIDSNNQIHINFAFGEFLNEDELKKKLESYHFQMEVPDFIIDIYNQDYEEYMEDGFIVEYLREFDEKYQKETGLSLLKSK